jgi:hypothetical protein
VEFKARAENAYTEFERTSKPINKFDDMIVIIITKWDHHRDIKNVNENTIKQD